MTKPPASTALPADFTATPPSASRTEAGWSFC